jgi:alpha-1,2-mannosyltransferase
MTDISAQHPGASRAGGRGEPPVLAQDRDAGPLAAAGAPSPWSRTTWIIVVALAAVSLALAWAITAKELAEVLDSPYMVDLRIYLGASNAVGRGSIYDYADPMLNLGSTYPPIASILFVPLTWLTPRQAEITWTVINCACLAGACVLIARRHLGYERRQAIVIGAIALAPVLYLRPTFKTLGLGQVNIVLWTIVLVDLFAIKRKSSFGGVGVGIATALKLVPGIFIVLLLAARQWAAAARATLALLAMTALAWVLDPADSKTYWTKLLWQSDRVGPLADAQNNSLRFLFANTGLAERAQVLLWVLSALAIGVIGLWRASLAFRRGSVLYAALITGCVAALVSPISWTHHLVFLPIVILFLPRTPWKPLGWALVAASLYLLWDPVGVGYNLLTSVLRAWFMILVVLGVIGTDRPSRMLFPPRAGAPVTSDPDVPAERVTGWERAEAWWRERRSGPAHPIATP